MAAQPVRKFDYSRVQTQIPQKKQVVVHKRRWVTRGEKFLYTLFITGALGLSIYITSFSSSLDSINRNIQTIENEISNQQIENRVLEAKVNELKQPSRILAIAKENGLTIKNSNVKQASPVQ
ncbi:cell division protein FtsL [Melghiribacillus thermohalophilus]|uniref:Cell division protein FtsL n=1 Tax=Melghiribacillus thermohalophilus TaxID=1324956 RepID=A0A4R3ND77_9BACI|nr:cell division protein FtsL [Melghiribacillus thermohalophilus]TCT26876.1 cell division protein FtsL [Melghiribacillus thermohalophilus]